jgi:catechol 2,3-dioxygenase-like lactoylglutathione lyase family enzyme
MLDHISVGIIDLERSRGFYDAALRPVGLVRTVDFQGRGSDYGAMAGQFGVEFTITVETGVLPLPGMHLCFRAPDPASVREFPGRLIGAFLLALALGTGFRFCSVVIAPIALSA